MEENVKEFGTVLLEDQEKKHKIQLISIIGEIEGHETANNSLKTTKYEHILPMLVSLEEDDGVDGILFVINTIGGDVSCGLALSEMIASLSKPTVALVVGDSHSIGVPLSVSTDYTVIAPSATVIIHPVRMSGQVLGAPQTYEYFRLIQDRITGFIAKHSDMEQDELENMMVKPGILTRDLGTILVGEQAVTCGLFQEVGGIHEALNKMHELIDGRKQEQV